MALPEDIRIRIEKRLREYCEKKVPPKYRDELRLGFKVRGNSVTLFEERPSFTNPSEWVDIVVAQFRYNLQTKEWTLYCADRNSRWHEYLDSIPSKRFSEILQDVEEDVTGIFWG
jgi:hypothetical protein